MANLDEIDNILADSLIDDILVDVASATHNAEIQKHGKLTKPDDSDRNLRSMISEIDDVLCPDVDFEAKFCKHR